MRSVRTCGHNPLSHLLSLRTHTHTHTHTVQEHVLSYNLSPFLYRSWKTVRIKTLHPKQDLSNRSKNVWIPVAIIPSHNNIRSQWPRSLRRRSAAARLSKLWVRIPSGACMSVSCDCWVLSSRGLCVGPITHPGESIDCGSSLCVV